MITFPRGREVVLGVGAGIAAYKACDLLRRLQDRGFLVSVIPTPASLNFVGQATWEALSGRPANTSVWDGAVGVSHVALAQGADLVVIAPATADLIARIATGRADDLLTTTALATNAPILIVPAMHPGMWLNPATQANIATLRGRGIIVMDPDFGRLTGADSGVGRFPETARILDQVSQISERSGELVGRRVLVTAGGTVEAIDPVRYIGNRSSGRAGLAVAFEALREGAEVTVVAGSTEEFDLPGARVIRAPSAMEMLSVLVEEISDVDALVMAAAVADARPAAISNAKISKEDLAAVALEANPDLLATLAQSKRSNQVFVGFAAETEADLVARGMKKLHAKGVDLLYVTDVANGRVFGETETSGALLTKRGERRDFQSADKFAVAREIVSAISRELSVIDG
jgi:phosphopantothenoylcysteine decarboxylase/phosphopantothenate--cysteine ligase